MLLADKSVSEELALALAADSASEVRWTLARNPSISEAVQRALFRSSNLAEGTHDPTLEVSSVENPGLSPAVQLEGVLEEWFGFKYLRTNRGLSPEAAVALSFKVGFDHWGSLAVNPAVVWSTRMSAAFLRFAAPREFYASATMGVDAETFDGLLGGWTGSLEDLVEACRLVAR